MAGLAASMALSRPACSAISSVVAPRRAVVVAARPARAQQQRLRASKLAEVENSVKEKKAKREEEDEEEEYAGAEDGLSPQQVESFLSVLCEETDIAQVELKMGGFKMKVRRSLKGGLATAAAPAAAAPAAAAAAPAAYAAAAPAPTPEASVMSLDEDESLLPVISNKVGILRRARYVKGKQLGKAPLAQPGDAVKKGQVLCMVEQMGTHFPVEAPQAGELVEFLVDEGEPVEYKQIVVEISPYFGGHIIGDSKYA